MIDTVIAIFVSVAAFAVLLPLIVFVHEYGHFKVARLCGVRVDAFSIGFGKALISWTDKKGTLWKISAIPLGGYVKFFGDANAASAGVAKDEGDKPVTTQFNSERDRLAALLTEDEKKVCFHFKPVWQRALVVAAGPMANFLLALVIFATLFMTVGQRIDDTTIGRVVAGTPAAAAGFLPGDRVLAVDGAKVSDFEALAMKVRLSSNSAQRFTVDRNGDRIDLVATPERTEQVDALGNAVSQGRLGIEGYIEPRIGGFAENSTAKAAGVREGDVIEAVDGTLIYTYSEVSDALDGKAGATVTLRLRRDGSVTDIVVPVDEVSYTDPATQAVVTFDSIGVGPVREPFTKLSPIAATVAAGEQIRRIVDGTLTYLGRLVTFQEDPRQLGGPIKIAKYAGQAVSVGFDEDIEASLAQRILISLTTFIQLAALISVSIGLLNLLPVPVLDGGHLVYYAYEAVAGRPLSDRVQGFGFRIGIALVGSLMVFVVVNDVLQLF